MIASAAPLTSYPAIAASWLILGIIASFAFTIVVLIWRGIINLQRVISEPTGDASMSRFQLLIFTFVIATSFFLITVNKGEFAEVPSSVLGLLGISAGSYVVSKGIQFSKDAGVQGAATIAIAPLVSSVSAGSSISLMASVTGVLDSTVVLWSIEPPTGKGALTVGSAPRSLSATFTAPPLVAGMGALGGTVTVRATASGQTAVTSIATINLV